MVNLINASSVICGILLTISVYALSCHFDSTLNSFSYFFAYIAGSVGFLLTAPVTLILPIIRNNQDNTRKTVIVWAITTLAIFLLACAVGTILMLGCKWVSGNSNPQFLVNMFICGAFILFVSGGIHWLAYRRKRER